MASKITKPAKTIDTYTMFMTGSGTIMTGTAPSSSVPSSPHAASPLAESSPLPESLLLLVPKTTPTTASMTELMTRDRDVWSLCATAVCRDRSV